MSTSKRRVAKLLFLDYLVERVECGVYIEWDRESEHRHPEFKDAKDIPVIDGFELRYFDDEREMAVLMATDDLADFDALKSRLYQEDWIDSYCEVGIMVVPKTQPQDEIEAIEWKQFTGRTAVVIDHEDKQVLIFHRGDDLVAAAQSIYVLEKVRNL